MFAERGIREERSDGIAECNDASLFRCPILLSGAQGEAWGLTQKATGGTCSFPVAFVACFEPKPEALARREGFVRTSIARTE